jgi:ABC-type transporter Mla subunit MlaD
VFFLILVGGFVGFAAVVAGQSLFKQYETYYVRYTDTSVSGLQVGGTVIYQGIAIGTIESINIDPSDVESIIVELNVQEGTPIKTDVTAQIVPVGITGISQIQLSGGTQDAERLEPGSFIPPAESTVTEVTESVQSILEGIEGVLSDISGMLDQIDQQSIGSILSRVDSMLEGNQQVVESLLVELEAAVAGFADAGDELESLIGSAGSVTADFDLLLRRNAPEIGEAVEVLNDTLRMLNNFAFQINNDPSILIIPEQR